MRRRVARIPGWAAPCRWSNTCRRRSPWQNVPVAVSPMRSRSPTFCETISKLVLEQSVCTWGQRIWRRAMSLRSRGALSAMAEQAGAAVAAMPETGRESASAMTLDVPGTNTRMLVYSDMNASWRCLWPDVGGDTLLRAKIRGLWSVQSWKQWKGLPSSRERKCLIPETAATIALCRRSSNLRRFWIVF